MKYLTTFFIAFIGFILAIGALAWFIDPYGMYWSPIIENVNKVKPEAGTRTRITKAYRVNEVKPHILLVGNSRVEMGLAPTHPLFNNKRVYNQAMPGSSLAMQVDYAIAAIANNPSIEHIIMGVDYFDFLSAKEVTNQAPPSYLKRLNNKNTTLNAFQLKEQASLIFSLDAFTSSLNTIYQQPKEVSSITPLGFNTANTYKDIMRSEGIKALFVQKLSNITKFLQSDKKIVNAEAYRSLDKLIHTAGEREIKLNFFISPYHYSYLHWLAKYEHWHSFLSWKKALALHLVKYDGQLVLWDFSGFNDFVVEQVNTKNKHTLMQWYWEPAHYRKELGDKLLSAMLIKNNNSFGLKLNSHNIANIIIDNQKGMLATKTSWKNLERRLFSNEN